MANLKDTIVFGKLIATDIIASNKDLLAEQLILETKSGEGGQIQLKTALSDKTTSGIVIDTANGDFRIFGLPSRDGITRTGNGTVLTIDPYDKTIAGGYSFNGGAATFSGKVAITNTEDADAGKSSGAFTVGAISGQHLAIDGNEIMSKSNASTAATLYLNNQGGLVQIGSGGLTVSGVITGTLSGNASTATTAGQISDITTSDQASNSEIKRRIWFAYSNNTTGRPAYDDRFTIQTSTGTLFAPTFSGSLSGNAATATKLQTPRTISLTGSVAGSGSFDGSGNLSINTTTNHTHNYLPLVGGTMSGRILTSFKSSVATGSYQAEATTIPDLLNELRYSSGCMGSVSIGTAYTNGVTIAAGWYNFLYLPHRSGGVNGAASGDNCNYGTLLLMGMTVGNACYRIRYTSSAIAEVVRISDSNSYSAIADGRYVTLNTAQTITALKTMNAGLTVSGRVANSGDDEGIVIGFASNGYAGLTLGGASSARSVFYFKNDGSSPFWRYNNGSASYDLYHPSKAGTIAVTSDLSSYLPLSGGTLTGALNFKNSTWNLLGDDVYFGDNDIAGAFCIKGNNGTTNLRMVQYGGTAAGTISWNGSTFTVDKATTINGTIHANGGYLTTTANKCTVTIGAQNETWCHIYNNKTDDASNGLPFIFNQPVYTFKYFAFYPDTANGVGYGTGDPPASAANGQVYFKIIG